MGVYNEYRATPVTASRSRAGCACEFQAKGEEAEMAGELDGERGIEKVDETEGVVFVGGERAMDGEEDAEEDEDELDDDEEDEDEELRRSRLVRCCGEKDAITAATDAGKGVRARRWRVGSLCLLCLLCLGGKWMPAGERCRRG